MSLKPRGLREKSGPVGLEGFLEERDKLGWDAPRAANTWGALALSFWADLPTPCSLWGPLGVGPKAGGDTVSASHPGVLSVHLSVLGGEVPERPLPRDGCG